MHEKGVCHMKRPSDSILQCSTTFLTSSHPLGKPVAFILYSLNPSQDKHASLVIFNTRTRNIRLYSLGIGNHPPPTPVLQSFHRLKPASVVLVDSISIVISISSFSLRQAPYSRIRCLPSPMHFTISGALWVALRGTSTRLRAVHDSNPHRAHVPPSHLQSTLRTNPDIRIQPRLAPCHLSERVSPRSSHLRRLRVVLLVLFMKVPEFELQRLGRRYCAWGSKGMLYI
ncbi:hypothetical protein BDQ12DRAFT_691658, partial [Crucibulum laeve]